MSETTITTTNPLREAADHLDEVEIPGLDEYSADCLERVLQHTMNSREYSAVTFNKFAIKDKVQKVKGYKFPGVVIGIAEKLDGRVLYLVECTAEGAQGVCHIYGENDLERQDEPIDFTT